jgi:hypothetical protein
MLIYQQKASIKFHFGIEIGDEFYDEGIESLRIAMAMREYRNEKLSNMKDR